MTAAPSVSNLETRVAMDASNMSDMSAEELQQFIHGLDEDGPGLPARSQPCDRVVSRLTPSSAFSMLSNDDDKNNNNDASAVERELQGKAEHWQRMQYPNWEAEAGAGTGTAATGSAFPDWQSADCVHGPQSWHSAPAAAGGEASQATQAWPEAETAAAIDGPGMHRARPNPTSGALSGATQARLRDPRRTTQGARQAARQAPPQAHQHPTSPSPSHLPPQARVASTSDPHLQLLFLAHNPSRDDPQATQLDTQAFAPAGSPLLFPITADGEPPFKHRRELETRRVTLGFASASKSAPPPPTRALISSKSGRNRSSDQASTKLQTATPGPPPTPPFTPAMPSPSTAATAKATATATAATATAAGAAAAAAAAAAGALAVEQTALIDQARLRSHAPASVSASTSLSPSGSPAPSHSSASAVRASPFQASASEVRRDTGAIASAQPPSSYAHAAATVGTAWLYPGVPQDRTLPFPDADSDDRAVVDAGGLGLHEDFTATSPFPDQASESGPWKHALSDTQDTSSALPSGASPPQRQRNLRGQQQQQQQPQHRKTRNPQISTPAIRVVTGPDSFSNLEPHHQPHHEPQDEQHLPQDTSTDITTDAYYPGTSLSPSAVSHSFQEPAQPYYAPVPPRLSSSQSQHLMPADQQEMQTPPRSPLDHQLMSIDVNGLQLTRKRSHSAMSTDHPPDEMHHLHHANHHRSPSLQSMGEPRSPQAEGYSPRARTIKRDNPPVNQDGKYFCNYAAECDGQIFDRKCEWSKHMDKHDRPYRCPHPSCAKLQGFTYSGGLLRHEREVHGKHGGPKAQLMCPFPNCKRHSGKGFTRKENLNEHVRRVHESRAQNTTLLPIKRDADVLAGADNAETPGSRISEALTSDSAISPELKRRRTLTGLEGGGSEDVEDLRQEIIRLRAENAEKDRRLMHMEQKMEEADQRREDEMNQMRALHEEMRQMQHTQVAT